MATDAEILADMRNTIGTSYVLAAMRRAYQRNDLVAADAHGESLHRLLVVSWREDDENARRMVAAVLRAIRAEVTGVDSTEASRASTEPARKLHLFGGDPCPRCGAELEWDEVGEDREPEVWCPNTRRAADSEQGCGVPPVTACHWTANGYPATNP